MHNESYPLGGYTGTELSIPPWTAVRGDTRRLPPACGAQAAAWGFGRHSRVMANSDKAKTNK
jgi:hypothetical protein